MVSSTASASSGPIGNPRPGRKALEHSDAGGCFDFESKREEEERRWTESLSLDWCGGGLGVLRRLIFSRVTVTAF